MLSALLPTPNVGKRSGTEGAGSPAWLALGPRCLCWTAKRGHADRARAALWGWIRADAAPRVAILDGDRHPGPVERLAYQWVCDSV